MKMNQKLFELANEAEPYEVQELEGHRVELFLMDSFEGVKEEYVIKNGKFAVWTSLDGVSYRLFLENGYYEALKELYQAPINQIWMDFWDTADNVSGKFSKQFVYPMIGISVILCVLSLFLGEKMGAWGTYVILGLLLVMFIAMIFVNTRTKKQIINENVKARDKVAEYLGGERFDELLEIQKKYMDDFFENLYPEDKLDEDGNPITDEELEDSKALDNEASDSEVEDAEVVDNVASDSEVQDAEIVDNVASDSEVQDAKIVEDEPKNN